MKDTVAGNVGEKVGREDVTPDHVVGAENDIADAGLVTGPVPVPDPSLLKQ